MDKLFIKPAKGVKLYDPDNRRFIKDAGQSVPKNQYWLRRVTEGGAVKFDPQATRPAAKKKSKSFGAAVGNID